MDALTYFLTTSSLIIAGASLLAFLLGLALGWLTWGVFRKLYHELFEDTEAARKKALQLQAANAALEDAHRAMVQGTGELDTELAQAREQIFHLQESMSRERRLQLESFERLRQDYLDKTSRSRNEHDDFRQNVTGDLSATRAEAAQLRARLEELETRHAALITSSQSELARITRETEAQLSAARQSEQAARAEMTAIKNSEIHTTTSLSESLRHCRMELEQYRRKVAELERRG